MTSGHVWALAAVLGCILAAGFFGAAATAMTRMSLNRAQKMFDEEKRGAGRLVALMEDPARTLNILALVVLAFQLAGMALLTVVFMSLLRTGPAVAIAALVGSAAFFIGAEVVPKTFALQHTDEVARLSAPWVRLVGLPVAPLAGLLIRLGNLIAPGKGLAAGPFVTEEDVREMIDVAESDEIIEESERAMIHSIFELGDTVVREIMVPRPDMIMVSVEDSLHDVLEVVLREGHSRIPVYQDDRDKIVGLVYAKDLLRRLHDANGDDGDDGDEQHAWHDLMRSPYFVPELKRVDELLRELQAEKVHLAVVVDEYGATAGLVTIEDIIEEIVGEIVDEYDEEQPLIEQREAGGLRVDARLPVDELGELMSCELPSEEWDTVGGLLFGMLGHVPTPGEHIEVEHLRLTAETVRDRRIASVLVDRLEPSPGPAER